MLCFYWTAAVPVRDRDRKKISQQMDTPVAGDDKYRGEE